MTPNTAYHSDGDYSLFSGQRNGLIITNYQFAVLSPEDVHHPALHFDNRSSMIKIIVKALI